MPHKVTVLLILVLAGVGCSRAVSEEDESAEIPESIDSIYPVEGGGQSDQDGGEVQELGLCHIARDSHSLVIALIDERAQYTGDCEDRPFPRPFNDIYFTVIDDVAGDAMATEFVARASASAVKFDNNVHVGDFVVARIRTFEGEHFVSGVVPVAFTQDDLSAFATDEGLDYVWDFPTNDYDEFRSILADTWEEFETLCPEYSVQNFWDEWTTEEIAEYHFGDPICLDGQDDPNQEFNAESGDPEGDDDGL